MNGGFLLSGFTTLATQTAGVVDIDLTHLSCVAWVVGRDSFGDGWQARIVLEQSPIGTWMASGSWSASKWDGWIFFTDAQLAGWTAPVIDLGFDGGSDFDGSYTAVHGVARQDVTAIEVGLGKYLRRKTVSSPSGGFVLNIPLNLRVADPEHGSPNIRAILFDGTAINLNP